MRVVLCAIVAYGTSTLCYAIIGPLHNALGLLNQPWQFIVGMGWSCDLAGFHTGSNCQGRPQLCPSLQIKPFKLVSNRLPRSLILNSN